ncbi:hypothetical protein TcasGA2_TC010258 [Tribolium castaneum]|uniref:Uncharacterized protein n=1 Tax=Tribolium castaneum TaxID=7070 RepID=D7EJB1_TRICA|nr:hypothetical protein TcasGA2_TC010258 [Tribolium castaneum]
MSLVLCGKPGKYGSYAATTNGKTLLGANILNFNTQPVLCDISGVYRSYAASPGEL